MLFHHTSFSWKQICLANYFCFDSVLQSLCQTFARHHKLCEHEVTQLLLAGHMTHADDTHLRDVCLWRCLRPVTFAYTPDWRVCGTMVLPAVVNCGTRTDRVLTIAGNPLRFHASKTKAPSLRCTSGCRYQINGTVQQSVVNNRYKLWLHKRVGLLLYIFLPTVVTIQLCAWVAIQF